jgi:hypothetical protein
LNQFYQSHLFLEIVRGFPPQKPYSYTHILANFLLWTTNNFEL